MINYTPGATQDDIDIALEDYEIDRQPGDTSVLVGFGTFVSKVRDLIAVLEQLPPDAELVGNHEEPLLVYHTIAQDPPEIAGDHYVTIRCRV